jgi:hypothetical protein
VIRYALSCAGGHSFEAWFSGSDAYEEQRSASMITCPECGSTAVGKALMAPAVSTSRKKPRLSPQKEEAAPAAGHSSAQQESVTLTANVAGDGEAVALLRKLRKHLVENAEYVGSKFAEEARRIHYNESKRRGIYGEATPDDAQSLAEEGIEFHPLPLLPEDHN